MDGPGPTTSSLLLSRQEGSWPSHQVSSLGYAPPSAGLLPWVQRLDRSQPAPNVGFIGINVSSPNIAGRENLVMDALLVISAIGVFYSNSVVSNRQTVEFIDRISVASN